ncbi:MAG: hypothetical protein IJC95_05580 [Clostridia bacterium]|nr:hypothetical protein [Clostridia bacterium]
MGRGNKVTGLVDLKREALEENRMPRWLNATTCKARSAFFPPLTAKRSRAELAP